MLPDDQQQQRQELYNRLAERYGADVIRAGLRSIEYARAAHRFNHPEIQRPQPVVITQQETQEAEGGDLPRNVKIWPLVGLAAVKSNHGGGWRAWSMARALDARGSGWVEKQELWRFFTHLKIGERKRRRWLSDALELRIMTENRGRYYLVNLGRCAIALNSDVGKPAEIAADALTREGWRSVVWAAYLVILKNRPVSQVKAAELTGVSERTQRNYQSWGKAYKRYKSGVSVSVRRNYAQTNLHSDYLSGVRDHGRSSAFVGFRGLISYRLPDMRFVAGDIAKLSQPGRSRKAQKTVNKCSFSEDRANGKAVFKVFHETQKSVNSALRKIINSDFLPWEGPAEVFRLAYPGRNTNIWEPVQVR